MYICVLIQGKNVYDVYSQRMKMYIMYIHRG